MAAQRAPRARGRCDQLGRVSSAVPVPVESSKCRLSPVAWRPLHERRSWRSGCAHLFARPRSRAVPELRLWQRCLALSAPKLPPPPPAVLKALSPSPSLPPHHLTAPRSAAQRSISVSFFLPFLPLFPLFSSSRLCCSLYRVSSSLILCRLI